MNDFGVGGEEREKKCNGHVQSNPAVKIFGNADDKTSARTSYPSSVNESKSFPYACTNSNENALTGPLFFSRERCAIYRVQLQKKKGSSIVVMF